MTAIHRELDSLLSGPGAPPNFPAPPAWTDQALCAETDPEAFFPPQGGSPKTAQKVCAACPVREQCLEYGLEHQDPFGIYGGLTPRSRRKVLRQRAREAS